MIAINSKTGEATWFGDRRLAVALNVTSLLPAAPNAAEPAPQGEDAIPEASRTLAKRYGWDLKALYPEHFTSEAPNAPAAVPRFKDYSKRGEDAIPADSRALARKMGWDLKELYPEHFDGDTP